MFDNPSSKQVSKHLERAAIVKLRLWGRDLKNLVKDVARLRKARKPLWKELGNAAERSSLVDKTNEKADEKLDEWIEETTLGITK